MRFRLLRWLGDASIAAGDACGAVERVFNRIERWAWEKRVALIAAENRARPDG
jgi:hypothetical protein